MNTTTEMQLVPVEKLIPYINNARTHSDEQIKKLRSSLREFGFINPVIIDRDFNVIAGHGRILAAKAENISEIPCVFVDYLNDAQKKDFYAVAFPLMQENMERLQKEVAWFVEKNDYRNKDKDWGTSADSIQRGMQKCAGGFPADETFKAKL